MAPTLVSSPPTLRIAPEPLTPQAFAPFGTVIASPFPRHLIEAPQNLSTIKKSRRLPATPVHANQGSAVKISPIAPLANGYENMCPSGKAAQARLSMFTCFPRKLRRAKRSIHHESTGFDHHQQEEDEDTTETPVFDVRILERHPFTTQTFVPLDLSSQKRVIRDRVPAGDHQAHDWSLESGKGETGAPPSALDSQVDEDEEQEEPIYLVIVAPTLKGQSATAATNASISSSSTSAEISSTNFSSNQENNNTKQVLIRDPPDLENLRAFIARGGQAVTYSPGTWHAPMVVLGPRRVDFVVVQYVNGVDDEDCQEAAFKEGIVVDLKSLGEEEDDIWNDLKKLSKL